MPRFFLLSLFYRWYYICLSTQVFLNIVAMKNSQFKKNKIKQNKKKHHPMLFLVYMPLEPQSGRCSQSTSNIYHQHKNLHKMLL